jgi:hypothetical protein
MLRKGYLETLNVVSNTTPGNQKKPARYTWEAHLYGFCFNGGEK